MSARLLRAEARAKAAAVVSYGFRVGVPWDVGVRILGYSLPRRATWGDVVDVVARDIGSVGWFPEPMDDPEEDAR